MFLCFSVLSVSRNMSDLYVFPEIILLANLAIPIIFVFLYFKVTNERNAFLTGVSATIPSLTFHTYISADYFVNNLTGADSFAFFAQWEMAGWVGPTFSISSFLVRRFVLKGLVKLRLHF